MKKWLEKTGAIETKGDEKFTKEKLINGVAVLRLISKLKKETYKESPVSRTKEGSKKTWK